MSCLCNLGGDVMVLQGMHYIYIEFIFKVCTVGHLSFKECLIHPFSRL